MTEQSPHRATTQSTPSGAPGERILTDGEWHRLHPATPLLRGGIVFIAIIGFIIANLRERLVEWFLPPEARFNSEEYDPLTYVVEHGILGTALLALLGLLIIITVVFFLSWRMHTFRVTNEAVEVRSGIVFRTHRQAKLDRIQGVNINRPMIARIFGAAKLEVSVAGGDSSVKLDYLYSKDADRLRADVLTLASGVKLAEAGVAPPPTVGAGGVEMPEQTQQAVVSDDPALARVINERVNEFLSPELDPNAAPPESIVRIPPGRLIASTVLSGTTVFILVMIVVVVVLLVNRQFWALFAFVPAVIGIGSYYVSNVMKSLRYSIAGTAAGVRVGFGLLSTNNDTIPPGRVHAVRVSQPILWRYFGWWQVKINKAGLSAEAAAQGKGNTTVLPVGTLEDVAKVLELMLEGVHYGDVLVELEAVLHRPQSSGFTIAPKRARWLDPIAWRRTGFALRDGLLLLRRGVLWRSLDLLPLARMQGFSISRGPIQRGFRLVSVRAHTVAGPITPQLNNLDAAASDALFRTVSIQVVSAAANDHSHRWGEHRPQDAA